MPTQAPEKGIEKPRVQTPAPPVQPNRDTVYSICRQRIADDPNDLEQVESDKLRIIEHGAKVHQRYYKMVRDRFKTKADFLAEQVDDMDLDILLSAMEVVQRNIASDAKWVDPGEFIVAILYVLGIDFPDPDLKDAAPSKASGETLSGLKDNEAEFLKTCLEIKRSYAGNVMTPFQELFTQLVSDYREDREIDAKLIRSRSEEFFDNWGTMATYAAAFVQSNPSVVKASREES